MVKRYNNIALGIGVTTRLSFAFLGPDASLFSPDAAGMFYDGVRSLEAASSISSLLKRQEGVR